MEGYDFSGWATRNDIKCSDGRTIKRNAFADNDGDIVPLVWNHSHNDANNVLGHVLLENREEGVYAYGKFNNNPQGENARELVRHGDVTSLSIYANKLKQNRGDVLHGSIREVSLVLAGANPGAVIDSVITHSGDAEEEAVIYSGEDIDSIYHSAVDEDTDNSTDETTEEEPITHSEEKPAEENKEDKTMPEETKGKTIKEVFDALTDEQKDVVYYLVGQAIESKDSDDEEGDEDMKHNVFDTEENYDENVIAHSDILEAIGDAKKYGSMKEAFLEHGIGDIETPEGTAPTYGIHGTEFLFPEAHLLNKTPEFIKRDDSWVSVVMAGVHKTPFSRIKSQFADITEDAARAKGYIKGHLKKEEVFSLLKRTTTPTTIYKKQKMDRDDVIDITDFDVITWLKGEMRMMLNEEIARAILIGDGREASDDDKISELNIRPIVSDHELFTIKKNDVTFATARDFINTVIRTMKEYKGSGSPTLFTTQDVLTECLLLTDETGRDLYEDESKLAKKLRVSKIVTVEAMEGYTDANDNELWGVIVNLADYSVGADKGGEVNMFEDFDIDYNAQKYLIETRCSGALVKPKSAIAVYNKHVAQQPQG